MDYTWPQEFDDLAAEARQWVAEATSDLFNTDDGWLVGYSDEFTLRLAEKGWIGMTWPIDKGGDGRPEIERFVVTAQLLLGRAPMAGSFFPDRQIGPVLLAYGTPEQQERFLPAMRHGKSKWCIGMSEPDAGSNVAGISTKATKDVSNWVVNGQKIWTSTAKYAHMMFCLVRTEPDAPKHKGISYLLIPMDTPGIEIRPLVDMTLDAGFNEVFFTDVRIPAGNIVGERGQGWLVANKTLVHERGSLGDPTAIVSRMNQLIELMKTETLDGTRIIDKPVFRDRVMKIQGRVLAFQNHGLRLLSARLNNRKDAMFGIMILKLIGTELRHELEGLAIDVMGELGTLYQDSPNLRDNGSWQFAYMMYLGLIIGGGTNQIQKNIIAERGLGLPKAPKIKEA